MKTKFEMSIEVAEMKDDELKDLIERLEFNKRTLIEEERMLEIAKLEVVKRFLGKDDHFIDQNGLLKKKINNPVCGLESIWFE